MCTRRSSQSGRWVYLEVREVLASDGTLAEPLPVNGRFVAWGPRDSGLHCNHRSLSNLLSSSLLPETPIAQPSRRYSRWAYPPEHRQPPWPRQASRACLWLLSLLRDRYQWCCTNKPMAGVSHEEIPHTGRQTSQPRVPLLPSHIRPPRPVARHQPHRLPRPH